MKILVTGGAGRIGRIVCRGLAERGYHVIALDLREWDCEGVDTRVCNILDKDALLREMEGIGRVVHLANYIPGDARSSYDLFHLNVSGTYNVFQACADTGVTRVTVASSPNAIGYYYGVRGFDLSYLPVDGSHPSFTSDVYSYGKQTIEEMGRYFWRRDRICSVFFRFGSGYGATIEENIKGEFGTHLRSARAMVDELLSLPKPERIKRVSTMERCMNEKRERAHARKEELRSVMSEEEMLWRSTFHSLISALDRRDLITGIIRSLESDYQGSHALFLCDHSNTMAIPAMELAELAYPGAELRVERLQGFDALCDYRQTRDVIGFEAEHSIREHYRTLYG